MVNHKDYFKVSFSCFFAHSKNQV